VGTKKRDHIDPILDHFSINAANPLAVMTQDTARTFLSGAARGGLGRRQRRAWRCPVRAPGIAGCQLCRASS
jgi:hypothetical protein